MRPWWRRSLTWRGVIFFFACTVGLPPGCLYRTTHRSASCHRGCPYRSFSLRSDRFTRDTLLDLYSVAIPDEADRTEYLIDGIRENLHANLLPVIEMARTDIHLRRVERIGSLESPLCSPPVLVIMHVDECERRMRLSQRIVESQGLLRESLSFGDRPRTGISLLAIEPIKA